jgi:hypothetical protein
MSTFKGTPMVWQVDLSYLPNYKKSLRTISLFLVEAMMDRERKDELPQMQVEFIDSVCVPLYSILSERSEGYSDFQGI